MRALLADDLPSSAEPLVGNALRERRDALDAAIARLHADGAAIRRDFPFTLEAELADPAWVAARQAEIAARCNSLADQRLLLEAVLAQTLREKPGG